VKDDEEQHKTEGLYQDWKASRSRCYLQDVSQKMPPCRQTRQKACFHKQEDLTVSLDPVQNERGSFPYGLEDAPDIFTK